MSSTKAGDTLARAFSVNLPMSHWLMYPPKLTVQLKATPMLHALRFTEKKKTNRMSGSLQFDVLWQGHLEDP